MEETNKYIEVTDAMKIARAKKDKEFQDTKNDRLKKLFSLAEEADEDIRKRTDGRLKVNRWH